MVPDAPAVGETAGVPAGAVVHFRMAWRGVPSALYGSYGFGGSGTTSTNR